MTDDTEFISVRLPADVANWLRQYASDNNLIRAGKPNMGGSIISAIRERINGIKTMSNNVGQTNNLDIQAMIDTAIAAKLLPLENQITQLDIRMRDVPDDVQSSLEPIHSQLQELREAAATAKKPLLQIAREKVIAA